MKKIFPLKPIWAILTSSSLSCFLTHLSINVMETYGLMLFIGTPFFCGCFATIMHSYRESKSLSKDFSISGCSVCLMALFMLITAIDGAICILLLMPLAIVAAFLGTLFARLLLKYFSKDKPKDVTLILLVLVTPLMMGFEAKINLTPPLRKVITAVEINSNIHKVWNLVVAFPDIEEPDELFFKLGVSYPINAHIEGKGVGAVRYCNFSTGSFVEPITNWQAPYLLQFDVKENPVPMKETSIYANLEPPHLHHIVISERGQFKLKKITEYKTVLEGTTWYRHDMWPNWYWGTLSDEIIHTIHRRVLNHIKYEAEKK